MTVRDLIVNLYRRACFEFGDEVDEVEQGIAILCFGDELLFTYLPLAMVDGEATDAQVAVYMPEKGLVQLFIWRNKDDMRSRDAASRAIVSITGLADEDMLKARVEYGKFCFDDFDILMAINSVTEFLAIVYEQYANAVIDEEIESRKSFKEERSHLRLVEKRIS